MYKPPTPEELKNLIHKKYGLSRSEAGALADVTGDKIGKWSAGKGQMPFSVLHTIVNKQTSLDVSASGWREEV